MLPALGGFEALGGVDDAAECRRAVDSDILEFVPVVLPVRFRLQTSDFQPSTNFRVFRVFRGSIHPLLHVTYTVKNRTQSLHETGTTKLETPLTDNDDA